MNKDTLNILSDAISDVGSWRWWYTEDDMFQIEFCDIQFYDDSKPEKDSHSLDVLAIRFTGNCFAVFMDNYDSETDRNWYERLHNDELAPFAIETYEFGFDDAEMAIKVFDSYRNKIEIKNFKGIDIINSSKHILFGKCNDVGFVVGGDELAVVGRKGVFTEEEIVLSAKKWWSYWRDYWRLRKTKDAYEKDWACEVTIPADKDAPKGNWYEEDQSTNE